MKCECSEILSQEEAESRALISVRQMFNKNISLDEAFKILDSGEIDGTFLEAELKLLRRFLES